MSVDLLSLTTLSNLAFEFVRLCDHYTDWPGFPQVRKPLWTPRPSKHEQVFRVLLRENLRSLHARYGFRRLMVIAGHARACDWHFVEPTEEYRRSEVNIPELVRLGMCYDYQACESKGYHRSHAAKIIRELQEAAFNLWLTKADTRERWQEPIPGYMPIGWKE